MKKKIWMVIVVWFVLSAPVVADDTQTQTDDSGSKGSKSDIKVVKQSEFKNQMSYALGYDIFSHVSGQVDLDMESFLKGIQDAQANTPNMDEDQMRQMLAAYQRLARQKEREKFEKVRSANLARGGVFMEANKLKEGVVTLSSGLQYRVIKSGDGAVPGPDDSVECNYRGTLLDGTEFDSSYSRGRPSIFQVSSVIPGWIEALTRMPVGSKWELYIPANLAYGDKGAGEIIGPGQTLIFEVELLGILDPS